MKSKLFSLSIVYAIMLLFTSCSNHKDLAVSVKDSETDYIFAAQYDRSKTIAVQQYINEALKPNRIFADHSEEVVKDIKLTDGSVFHLESSPGDFTVEFEKNKNSKGSYDNMRKVCLGVREIVAGK
ncbi:hypothetical protein [Dyadobacter psychrophilus]|uniref:Uncharacterized protein n=1 Tax=Dyadobacter psychrophilus TaxID=651661 RepID=A0A1T5G5T9_9BACT|nr:hypothetical protein [Dyadobacter psychrophilus]SKC03768.1 hypothetical protein SAMN05660293_03700 [Dyadobacter psychrophilus]